MHTFTLLHISDLQERGPHEGRQRRSRVVGSSWTRNVEDMARMTDIDLVCFTGDVAYSGRPDEYEYVERFLSPLLRQFRLDRERLFVVPGNHDIDRDVNKKEWELARAALRESRTDAVTVSRWLGPESETPPGFDCTWRDALLARQSAFRTWLRHFGLVAPDASLFPVGYRAALQIHRLPFSIQVLGLDSAWLSGAADEHAQLRLTDGQVLAICCDRQGGQLPGFRLALMHHPLSYLADRDLCQRRLAEFVDVLLLGHLHSKVPELWADPGHSLRAFAAGCLYREESADNYPNSCMLVRVTCDAAGRPQHYQMHLRSFDPLQGHWYDDTARLSPRVYGSWLHLPVATHGEPLPTDRPTVVAMPPGMPASRLPKAVGGVLAAGLTLVAASALRPGCPPPPVPAATPPHAVDASQPVRTVHWAITSVPTGADVIGADGQRLGKTPWERTAEARHGTTQLHLELPGYKATALSLDQSLNVDREVVLTKLASPRATGFIPY